MSWKTCTNLPFTPGFSQKGAWTAPKPPPTKKKKKSQNNSAPESLGDSCWIYPVNTHYIRCTWGWLLRVPSERYHHFPCHCWYFMWQPFSKSCSARMGPQLKFSKGCWPFCWQDNGRTYLKRCANPCATKQPPANLRFKHWTLWRVLSIWRWKHSLFQTSHVKRDCHVKVRSIASILLLDFVPLPASQHLKFGQTCQRKPWQSPKQSLTLHILHRTRPVWCFRGCFLLHALQVTEASN